MARGLGHARGLAHARGLVGALVSAALAVCGCKPSSSSSRAPAGSASLVAVAGRAQPQLQPQPTPLPKPATAHAPLAEPIDATTALAKLPELKTDPMIAPVTTADGRQVHGTWCLDGTGADRVMHDLAASLAKAGWTNVTTRGDVTKAGVSAERDGYRASYVVSASTANQCRAPGHYFASLTMFRMR